VTGLFCFYRVQYTGSVYRDDYSIKYTVPRITEPRKKVNRGKHGDVPVELMKWVWSAGRKLPGLMRRRQAEGALYSAAMLAGRSRIGADEG
jgi:hypothetical protein